MTAAIGDRGLFPELEARAYLNHAGISPPSLDVKRAIRGIFDDYARRGAGAFTTWMDQRKRLKEKLARLIGAPTGGDLAIMPNTTRGVIDVSLALPWTRGDRVILFSGEFPANVTPWQRAAEIFGLEITFLPATDYLAGDDVGLARLEAELAQAPARLVAVSAVEFQTGVRMPLAKMSALAHAAGAELFVDAVQCVGATPIDVIAEGIDYLACGSHKWLMGPEGAGFLYVKANRMAALRPSTAGWLSHEEGLKFLFEGPGHLRYDRPLKRTAEVFEGANVNAAGCVALEASVDILLELGVTAIHAHVNRYLDQLEPALIALGFTSARRRDDPGRSTLLCLRPPADVDVIAFARELGSHGVAAATPDGWLRLSPHWPNGLHEVPFVVEACEKAMDSVEESAPPPDVDAST